ALAAREPGSESVAVPPSPSSPSAPISLPSPAQAAGLDALRVQRTPLGDRWAEAVAAMQAAGGLVALVRELAMQAELTAVDEAAGATCWQLKVERETLRSASLVDKLKAALQNVQGSPVTLEVVPGIAQDSPSRREAEHAALRQRHAEMVIQSDPLVQSLLAQFSTARIVSGSIKPV
ncbi:DNA polymerase III subunit gamma/tau C-terminal domain-containing protein, partial [Ideonella sp.]|uniref:DNA polymerase III subunit gamma/tau C-terminal domain-containing protein n=1 Tax=Ideonella sp. TaxID=1929293 RepID=UPI003BB78693